MTDKTDEITLAELENAENCQIVDIREELSFSYGCIDGAVNIPLSEFDEAKLDKSKHIILYCKSGIVRPFTGHCFQNLLRQSMNTSF